jgi:hypothetical protein
MPRKAMCEAVFDQKTERGKRREMVSQHRSITSIPDSPILAPSLSRKLLAIGDVGWFQHV